MSVKKSSIVSLRKLPKTTMGLLLILLTVCIFMAPIVGGTTGYFTISSTSLPNEKGLQVDQVNYVNTGESTTKIVATSVYVMYVYIETSQSSSTFNKYTVGNNGDFSEVDDNDDDDYGGYYRWQRDENNEYIETGWETNSNQGENYDYFRYYVDFSMDEGAGSDYQYCDVWAVLFVDIDIDGNNYNYFEKYNYDDSTWDRIKLGAYQPTNNVETGIDKDLFARFGSGTDEYVHLSTWALMGDIYKAKSMIIVNRGIALPGDADFYEPQFGSHLGYDIDRNFNDIEFVLEIKGRLTSQGAGTFYMEITDPGTKM